MHEISIAENIIKLIQNEYGNSEFKIKEIFVQVGELSGIIPDTLIFAFDQLKNDTKFSDTKINVEIIKCKLKCNNCGREYEISLSDITKCENCGSDDFILIGGTDIILSRIIT